MNIALSRASVGRRSQVFAMAAGDPQAQLAEHATLVRAMVGDVTDIKAEIDKLNERLAAIQAGPATAGGGVDDGEPRKPSPMLGMLDAYARSTQSQKSFQQYFSHPDGREVAEKLGIKAAMTTQSDPDGGYLAVPEVDATILRIARDQSPLRQLATVRTLTNSGSFEMLTDPSLVTSNWVGETEARPETQGPKLAKLRIPLGELYACPFATSTRLDDSAFDIAGWLGESVAISFAIKEGNAFVSGDGIKDKPRGFLTYATDATADFVRDYGKLQYIAAGSATPSSSQLADALLAMSMVLRSIYRPNARWLMSRDTARVIRQLKDSNGLLLWASDGRFVEGVQNLLLGFPVEYCEDLPAIAANAYPVALADWKAGYTIVDRPGIKVLRDPFTSKPYVAFYTTKRVGGSVKDFNAIKLLKIAAS
jgi:HK97 family phage major capsid protein